MLISDIINRFLECQCVITVFAYFPTQAFEEKYINKLCFLIPPLIHQRKRHATHKRQQRGKHRRRQKRGRNLPAKFCQDQIAQPQADIVKNFDEVWIYGRNKAMSRPAAITETKVAKPWESPCRLGTREDSR